jgi:hypothetical protein
MHFQGERQATDRLSDGTPHAGGKEFATGRKTPFLKKYSPITHLMHKQIIFIYSAFM